MCTRAHHCCGYESCSCIGVHFISGYRLQWDYCVDGKRITVDNDSNIITPSANEEQVRKLELHLLDDYAGYLRWRHDPTRIYRRETPVCPFSWQYPLNRYQKKV